MIGSYELGKTADKYISGDASFTWEEIKGDLFKVAMTGTSMWVLQRTLALRIVLLLVHL